MHISCAKWCQVTLRRQQTVLQGPALELWKVCGKNTVYFGWLGHL